LLDDFARADPLRLLLQPEDVNAIVAGKLAQRYAGPDVEAMKDRVAERAL